MSLGVPSLGQKPQRSLCLMFLLNLPNSTLNLFLDTADVEEFTGINSLLSSFCTSDGGMDKKKGQHWWRWARFRWCWA